MAIERFWYTDRKHIGIVEKNGSVTQDGVTSAFKSVSEAKTLRVWAISIAADIGSNLSDDFSAIPTQFHEAILYRAIAYGYLDPRNLDPNIMTTFMQLYQADVKKAKKHVRSQSITTGRVAQVDY